MLSFAEDHVNPNLLFVGTEFGLFFTVDGGKKWVRLRGNLPTIAVRDMVIQERENDLVLATFGRGFYVLDDYTPLRQLSQATFDRDGHVFPAKAAVIEVAGNRQGRAARRARTCGWRRTVRSARSSPTGSRTRRSRRGSGARWPRAARSRKASQYPTQAELTAEADEEAPQTFLTITDAAGQGRAPTDRARRARHPSLRLEPARHRADHRRPWFRRRRWRRRRQRR